VRRLPEGAALPGHRELARLRPRAGGQRLRRTLHPHAQGKPAVAADLRHGRRTAPGAARVPRRLQHHLADRAARLQDAGRRQTRAASTGGPGRV
ncbi:MAG: Mobile element protein, partial [uncultured Acetobacteraceae bacterium]